MVRVCVCGVHDSNQAAEVFLKDGSLNDGPDDEAFLQSLRRSLKTARGAYPPVALAEIYQEFKSPLTMIRRLHLMVVDLDRSRSVSPQVYLDFMNCRGSLDPAGSLNTLPVPISGKECPFQTRYVWGQRHFVSLCLVCLASAFASERTSLILPIYQRYNWLLCCVISCPSV